MSSPAHLPPDKARASAVRAVLAGGGLWLVEGDSPAADALRREFPKGVRSLPISERASSAVAVGAALAGRAVIVDVPDTSRLAALHEVLTEAVVMAAHGPVPVLWWVPVGGVPELDRPALDTLASVTGLRVVCPRHAGVLPGLVSDALIAGPTVLLDPRDLAGGPAEAAGGVVRAGAGVTVVAWGSGVDAALRAGGGHEVVDLALLSPLDVAALGERLRRTGRLVVAAPSGEGAYGRRVLQAGLDAAFLYLESPLVVVPAEAGSISAAVNAALDY